MENKSNFRLVVDPLALNGVRLVGGDPVSLIRLGDPSTYKIRPAQAALSLEACVDRVPGEPIDEFSTLIETEIRRGC
jgi:hypothetical protein